MAGPYKEPSSVFPVDHFRKSFTNSSSTFACVYIFGTLSTSVLSHKISWFLITNSKINIYGNNIICMVDKFLLRSMRNNLRQLPDLTFSRTSSFSKPFRRLTYVIAHSLTLPSLYLRHKSFSNSSVVSPRSQFIIQPFFRFSYVTGSSLMSPGEPPMEIWIVRNKDEDKISGHSTVEQATTVSFTEMEEV